MTYDNAGTHAGALPAAWAADAYWRAAVHILSGFPDCDGRIWAHVAAEGIDYPAMLDEPGWSAGQRRVLLGAASLWNGTPVSLLDLLGGLSDTWWQRINDAIDILRDGLS